MAYIWSEVLLNTVVGPILLYWYTRSLLLMLAPQTGSIHTAYHLTKFMHVHTWADMWSIATMANQFDLFEA